MTRHSFSISSRLENTHNSTSLVLLHFNRMGGETKPKICVIGGGLSGLCMAIKLKSESNLSSFTVYETCEDLGGCWFRNQYPGCTCDLPSHLYSYSFAPKYDWSTMYAPQPEIHKYMQTTADEFQVYPHFQFNTTILSLTWDDETFTWFAEVRNDKDNTVKTLEYDIVINCTGNVRDPKTPEEFSSFKGKVMHSSEWDHSVSFEGKQVAVIGTGASAVQIVPSIADKVKTLLVFQRSAPTVFPTGFVGWMNCAFVTWAVATLPFAQKLIRVLLYWMVELSFMMAKSNSILRRFGKGLVEKHRKLQLKSEKLCRQTEPKYKFLGKLPTVSDRYYPALNKSNVQVVQDKIIGVEGTTLKTEGKDYHVDILILATGFKTQDFFGPMKIFGKGGVDILQEWKSDRPRTYMGICDKMMPNLFSIIGPYSFPVHSAITHIEDQTSWTVLAINLMIRKNSCCITATKEAENDFMNIVDTKIKGTVFDRPTCSSAFVNDKGENTILWPDHQFRYSLMCRKVNENAFTFQ